MGGWLSFLYVANIARKVEEIEAVRMSYCELWVWWVGG